MNKIIEYIISAKDQTGSAVRSALSRVRSFASGVMSQMANIKAGLEMAWGVAQKFASIFGTAIKEAFKFEKVQSDFTGLLNSVDKAKEHIADLRNFASSTPLTFDDLSQASKLMLSFGSSVEDVMPSMKMLGDIAMGDSQRFQGLALVFSQVKSQGKLMGQDLMQMINQGFNPLTVISKETGRSMSELKDMMGEGKISFEMVAEAMRIATSDGGLFNDAMKNASKTGEGLMSTLQDKWTDAIRTFGEQFTDTAKGGIQLLIDKLTQLVEDGTIEVWANKIAKGLGDVIEFAQDCANAVQKVVDVYMTIRDITGMVGASVGGFVGTLAGGGSLKDAWKGAGQAGRQTVEEQVARDQETDQEEAEIREKARVRAEEAAKAETVKTESSANVQSKTEEAKSLEQMMAKADEDERMKAEKKLSDERKKLMREEAKAYAGGVSRSQSAMSDANARVGNAESEIDRLLGFYENPESYEQYKKQKESKAKAWQKVMADQDRLSAMDSSRLGADKGFVGEELAREMKAALEEKKNAMEYQSKVKENLEKAVEALEEMNATIKEGSAE